MQKVYEIVAKKAKIPLDQISADIRLKDDLDLDSVALIEISVEFYNQFDIDLSEHYEAGNALATVDDLVKAVKS